MEILFHTHVIMLLMKNFRKQFYTGTQVSRPFQRRYNNMNNRNAFQQDAYCPFGNCTCFSFCDDHQMSFLGDPQMITFEQVSIDHHQMSLAGGSPGLMSRWGGTLSDLSGGTLPCGLTHDVFDVTYPPNRQMQMPVKTLPSRKFLCLR